MIFWYNYLWETYCFCLRHLSVSPSTCPHYQIRIGGHLTVSRAKENNRWPSIKQKKIATEMALYPYSVEQTSVWLSVRTYKPRGTCVTWRTIGNSKFSLILFILFLLVCLFFKPCVTKNG
jgi:hypothetical protein